MNNSLRSGDVRPTDPCDRFSGSLTENRPQESDVQGYFDDVSAAILTGGKSRRMGQPKAILRLHEDSPTLIEHVASALRTVASDVFLVGQPDWSIPDTLSDLRTVEDARQGAADGLIAALKNARHDHCLVTACDMPFIDVTFLSALVAIARDRDRSVLAQDDTGQHPLHAIYRRADLPAIIEIVERGERSLMRICEEIGAVSLDVGDRESWRWSVFNINTPADLALAMQHAMSLKEHTRDD